MACRKMAVAILFVVAMVLPASPAMGSGDIPGPSPADIAAALEAARAPSAIGFARTNFRQAHGTEPATVTVTGRGVPVYGLNPDFVRGVPGAPAGALQYIAVTATADDGNHATLRADPDGRGGWTVGSVFSGDDEEKMSAGLRGGAVLMNEPQINGWYELTPDGVTLLRASLPQSPVGTLVPTAEYQRQVASRYGDKLDDNRGVGFTQPEPADTSSGVPWWPFVVVGVPVLAGIVLRYSQRKSTPATEGSGASK